MKEQEQIVNLTFQMAGMPRRDAGEEIPQGGTLHFSGKVNFNVGNLPPEAEPQARRVAQAFQNFLLPFLQRQGYWLVQVRTDRGYQPVPWIAAPVNTPYERYRKEGDHLKVTLRVPTEKILYLNQVQVVFREESTEVRVNGNVDLELAHSNAEEHFTVVFAPEEGKGIWVQSALQRDYFAEPLPTLKPTPPSRANLPAALWVPSEVVSRTVRRIAWGQLSLQKTDYGLPYYQAKTKESEVMVMPTLTTDDSVEIVLRLAQALQDEAIALDWCVALGLWLLDGGPGKPDVTLNLNDMLALEGHRKHVKGGYPTASKQALKERLRTLRQFDVRLNATVYQGSQAKTVSLTSQLCIADFMDELDEKDPQSPPIPYACWFRPGKWIDPFLGEETGDTKYLMEVMRNLFQFSNMPNDRWPFRLGLALNVEWRLGQSRSGVPYEVTVKRLLEEACLLGEDPARPQRVKEQFENAMERLLEAGCVRLPDMEHEGQRTYEGKPLAWIYCGLTEEELAAWEEQRPARGWFEEWLSWKVLLLPPDPEAKARLDRVREERKRLVDRQRRAKKPRRKT
jgi:hypothetical protein